MKKIFTFFLSSFLALTLFGTMIVYATDSRPSRMEDYADLLTTAEEATVREMLDELSEELQFDIVIVTTNSTGGKSSMAYADDFYDYNGYGMGDDYDGVLLLINMEYREWYISATGYGMKAIPDSDAQYIGEEIVDYLSYGDYVGAFEEFARLAKREVEKSRDAEELDFGEILLRVAIAIVIGMGLAFIPVSVMKSKMNNVKEKHEATDYMKRSQILMREQRDLFLYSTISRRRKPQQSSGGGGGGHVGSSGRSHSGAGGRF